MKSPRQYEFEMSFRMSSCDEYFSLSLSIAFYRFDFLRQTQSVKLVLKLFWITDRSPNYGRTV